MKISRLATKAMFLTGAMIASSAVFASATITVQLAVPGTPGGMSTVSLDWAHNEVSVTAVQFDVEYDATLFTAVDCTGGVSGALGAGQNFSSCTVVNISGGLGAGVDAARIIILGNPPSDFATGNIGSLVYTVAGTALPGVIPLRIASTVIQGGPVEILNDGSIVVSGPAISYVPANGATISGGAANVGVLSASSVQVTATESGTAPDDITYTGCAFSGANAGIFAEVHNPAVPDAMLGGSGDSNQNSLSCTPGARGVTSATLTCSATIDAGGALTDSVYTTDCTGTGPEFASDSPLALAGLAGGAVVAGNVTVTNTNSDTFSSQMEITGTTDDNGGGDPAGRISYTGVATFSVPVLGTQALAFACDPSGAAVAEALTETFTVAYEDTDGGQMATGSVTVTCGITSFVYESNPAPNNLFVFGNVELGFSSAAQTVDIGNSGSSALTVNTVVSDNAGIVVSGIGGLPYIVAAGATTADGVDTFDLTCTPAAAGAIAANITVTLADASTFTYTASCNGFADADFSANPAGGSAIALPNGVGNQDTTIALSNDASATADVVFGAGACVFSGVDAARFVLLTDPSGSSIIPNGTFGMDARCTNVTQGENLTATLTCSFTGDDPLDGTLADDSPQFWDLACSGTVFVIPTLSNIGMMLFALLLLVMGGMVVRRKLS